jgi:hypothetical protein
MGEWLEWWIFPTSYSNGRKDKKFYGNASKNMIGSGPLS